MNTARREILLLAIVALCVGFLASCEINRLVTPFRRTAIETELRGDWISATEPSYCSCFRQTLWIPESVQNAWIAVAAADGFEFFANGASVGRNTVVRPSRPFEYGLSETAQYPSAAPPLLGFRFPREYQWSGDHTERLPIYLDLTSYVTPGRNGLCLEVRSRVAPARIKFEGEILLSSGKRLPLQSDNHWKCEVVPPGGDSVGWKRADYFDGTWREAVPAQGEPPHLVAAIDPAMFTTPFSGDWICASKSLERAFPQNVCFATVWRVGAAPKFAWLRIASTEPYNLLVNGFPIIPEVTSVDAQGEARWVLSKPDLVGSDDSDEAAPRSPGSSTNANSGGNPNTQNWNNGNPPALNVYVNPRANADADATDGAGTPSARPRPPLLVIPASSFLSGSPPSGQSLPLQHPGRPQRSTRGVINMYDIQAMLRSGSNKIEIRIPACAVTSTAFPEVAVDGRARIENGSIFPAPPSSAWEAHAGTASESSVPVLVHPGTEIGRFHRKYFCGRAWNSGAIARQQGWIVVLGGLLPIAGILMAALSCRANQNGRNNPGIRPAAVRHLRKVRSVLIPAAVVLLAAVLIQFSLTEREEALVLPERLAAWALALAVLASCVFFLIARSAALRVFLRRSTKPGSLCSRAQWIRWLPLTALLVLCGLLRVGDISFQPVDDDEYASIQAVLSIADSGLPAYADGIYYTRSPLYHYVTGGLVHLLGGNLWALRLPGVLFAIATAALIYRVGARHLHSELVGYAATLLYAIHPFAIYTAHYARFYQQQQFFALLTIHYFLDGFVTGQTVRCRYLTLIAFITAVFSQELTLVLGIPLAIGYVLYAERMRAMSEVRFFAVCGCALLLVMVDICIFQTRCLTRLEGVSSNVEATFGVNFENPLYMLATFLGHARLHLALSILLFLGIPFAFRRRLPTAGALHLMLFAGAAATHILIIGAGARYQYWLLPLWLLVGVYNANALMQAVCGGARTSLRNLWRPISVAVLLLAVVIAFSPWRILASYQNKILGDSSGALGYVRCQKRLGDAVAITNPHTHAALLELGSVDYDIEIPLKYDYVYRRDGRLVDRNAGAPVISTPDHLWGACAKHDRLWILVNKEKMLASSSSATLNWSFPGARFESFLRDNCELKFQTYCWDVYLWDRRNGRLLGFRRSS
jgi:4-amino-4-deoxy-L-arabinose transferase-like glycosyltransferase